MLDIGALQPEQAQLAIPSIDAVETAGSDRLAAGERAADVDRAIDRQIADELVVITLDRGVSRVEGRFADKAGRHMVH